MANIKQQKKRNLQNERNRVKNSQAKSSIRTSAKKVMKAVETKDESVLAQIFKNFVKTIDTAAQKGIIKKETAARKKSRLAKKVNAAVASSKTA
ncbi:MAG TPA: 30S ribosomal protein S20 [Spirochaetota bacterium]|nr:30S ribosomal protein S20 [Spirochaetota bacterium]HPJ33662.1 30S ribosomal protein S20 [Spirochaetota bacterium]